MPGQLQFPFGHRPWLQALVLLLLVNAGFVALLLASNLIPREIIAARVHRAFSTNDLVQRDYLRYDRRRGWHQYNDCAILQMITNHDASSVGRALGPWLHSVDISSFEMCRTLHELIVDGRDPETLASIRYTRYWHGYIPPIMVLFTVFELPSVRAALKVSVYSAVVLLLLSGAREPRYWSFNGAVAVAGGLFWGLPYFGQGLSHSFGDSAALLGIACIVFWHRGLSQPEKLIPFCAMFGAVVVYFDMLTGSLPVAAGLLFPIVYLTSRLVNRHDHETKDHLLLAATALSAFALGAFLTVAARILVAAALVRPSGLEAFAGNLEYYFQPLETEGSVMGFLQPLGRLVAKGAVLTYGSTMGMAALYLSAALAWIASAWLAYRRRNRLAFGDLTAYVVGAASVPIWAAMLPTHTFIHAGFMARILIVPISLGWAAMLWQLHAIQRER